MSRAEEIRVGEPYRPLAVKLINAAGRAAHALGVQPVKLDAESIVRKATKKAGSADFADGDVREGLTRFLESADREGELTLLGRVMVQSYATGNLVNRLRVVEWRKKHLDVEKEEIVRPLFIVGLPRTGTTILHAVLEQDPANRSPLSWEVQHPVPPSTPETWGRDPRIATMQKTLEQFFQLAPGFEAMHPMSATSPEECVAIFTQCFKSEQLQVQFNVPSYQAWVDEAEMRTTYEYHKRFLQHLQSGGVRGGRWVLKSPAHLNQIDTLLEVYPDARIVHTHRDPIKVCASIASLTAMLRGAGTDHIDLHEIGRQQLVWWAKLVNVALAQRKRFADRDDQFFDVKLREMVADPIDVVRRLYSQFGFELSDEVDVKMRHFMDRNPRDKHGSHTYMPEDFGIDPVRDREPFEEYIEHFGLQE
ncbi:MAG: sulfotransferase [Myxococcales bacterium]|nr:sulfotransferase [Deltaproteobacteria bacterium]MBT8481802.1 sulfotransferase [Deltaproteobacteria bacterium]NNL24664.1 sulfotransferase [Myxococcales bacterium]